MSVNLVKGQKVELRKSDGGSLHRVVVGLGWDEVPQKKGFFGFGGSEPEAIDCDASAFLLTNGKLVSREDTVYYANLSHISGSVRHMGDNLTGAGDGDDEQITVDLDRIPAACDRIVFVVNIYCASRRNQHFGMIQNAFIRIFDADTNQEICKYNLSENYDGMTAMIFGEMYRNNGAWKFNAIGQATRDDNIEMLSARFR